MTADDQDDPSTDSETNGATGPGATGPMQGLLSHFCEALEQGLSPLLAPIGGLIEDFDRPPTEVPLVLPSLREAADQLSLLVDKMAEQQAYVLIFGPLKSGKSTLMNAICGKYVSEVSCLPAYPCLVHVAHAEKTRCQVTRYSGATQLLDDEAALTKAVAADHQLLIEAIRSCEAAGLDFEPQQHATNAIRRIDIRVPAGDLAESGAVLVDTPGLYARMKFGYDRMTRDFRNAAACAIFVVKTDNLFLDQVFAEFEDLLELFGRIFLVVNLDSTKQDLQPDGSLAPSLEHADPQAVVRAFENLAMTAALRDARQDGRLQIYPVDLMHAASSRISTGHDSRESSPSSAQGFDALLEDLTAYLNSNEYLRAFVADSMQRAAALLEDLDALLAHDDVTALQGRALSLTARRQDLDSALAALGQVEAVDWQALFARQSAHLRERLEAALGPCREAGLATLEGALADWFENDASLGELCREQLGPELARQHDELRKLLRDESESQLGPAAVLADLEADSVSDLEAAGLDLAGEVRAVMDAAPIADELPAPAAVFDCLQLPVRRRLLDWLLFRRPATVRQHLFGPADAPELPIPVADKGRRLGERGRAAMTGQLQALVKPMFDAAGEGVPDAWLTRHQAELLGRIEAATSARRQAIERESSEVVAELAQVEAVVARLIEVNRLVAERRERVSALREEVAAVDPADLGRPADLLVGQDEDENEASREAEQPLL
ncbi:MAG: dynamin family protein [Gammaproteobacteria bacterium]|nr:dynamin family protein [Gammaproteobacteria bacterium]